MGVAASAGILAHEQFLEYCLMESNNHFHFSRSFIGAFPPPTLIICAISVTVIPHTERRPLKPLEECLRLMTVAGSKGIGEWTRGSPSSTS